MYIPFHNVDQIVSVLRTHSQTGNTWVLCVCDQHSDTIPALLSACKNENLTVCGGIFPGLIDGSTPRKEGIIAIPIPDKSQIFFAHLADRLIQWIPPLQQNNSFKSSLILPLAKYQSLFRAGLRLLWKPF